MKKRKRKLGIIPAHAGLTSVDDGRTAESRDHPRACGAHLDGTLPDKSISGSSPRMRGSQIAAHVIPLPDGIIPAHAGLTFLKFCL